MLDDTATYIEFLKEQGMEFIDVDENEYREASKNLYKDFIARGYFTEEDYQQLLNFVETF